jgi:hypothetical protein
MILLKGLSLNAILYSKDGLLATLTHVTAID